MAKYIDITSQQEVRQFTVEHISVVSVHKSSVAVYVGSNNEPWPYNCKDNDNALQARKDIIEAMVRNATEDHMDIITVRLDITKYQEPSK